MLLLRVNIYCRCLTSVSLLVDDASFICNLNMKHLRAVWERYDTSIINALKNSLPFPSHQEKRISIENRGI